MIQGRKRRTVLRALPGLWVFAVVGWECCVPVVPVIPAHLHVPQLLAAAPAIACAATGRRGGVVLGGACALLGLLPLCATGEEHVGSRIGAAAAILSTAAAGYLTAHRRTRLTCALARAREVAAVAQEAVLRPPPPRLGGLVFSTAYLSATRGAALGGDLYDVAATPYGVRIVIGDVRGHGLAAVGTVSSALGSFREAAHDEPFLDGVLRRMERALTRHREPADAGGGPSDGDVEDFLTLLLLEIRADDTVALLNCGHPWPYRMPAPHSASPAAAPVSEREPLPPLGLFPLPAVPPEPVRLRLAPGEGLFLCTDGAADARDVRRDFFPLDTAVRTAAVQPEPEAAVASVRDALLRHTRGHLADDVALLALRREPLPGKRSTAEPSSGSLMLLSESGTARTD